MGLVLFVASAWYLWRTFDWHAIGRVLRTVDLAMLCLGGGASIVAYWLLRAIRWNILLRRTSTNVAMVDVYLCTAVSLSFSLFTPFQSGEAIKVELLKKYGMITRSPAYGTFLVERALDLVAVLSMACVSLLTTLDLLPDRRYAYYFLAVLAAGAGVGMVLLAKLRLGGSVGVMLGHMRACVHDTRTLLLVSVTTAASWSVVAFSWQIILASASVRLNFPQSIAMMSVVALIGILSFIPGGLGITEAGSAQVLTRFGFASATAQAGAIVLRSYSIIAIVLGVLHLVTWKLLRARRATALGKAGAGFAAEEVG